MTASAASIAGIGAIVVRPAPRRAERIRWLAEVSRRVDLLPGWLTRAEPIAVEASRLLARDGSAPSGEVAAVRSGSSALVPHTSQ
jgi:hypothetical protein